jgi:hypothetical protein
LANILIISIFKLFSVHFHWFTFNIITICSSIIISFFFNYYILISSTNIIFSLFPIIIFKSFLILIKTFFLFFIQLLTFTHIIKHFIQHSFIFFNKSHFFHIFHSFFLFLISTITIFIIIFIYFFIH